MKNVVERQLIKIIDDLIVKKGYVERVVDEGGGVDWLMSGRPISDEHVKELLEERYVKICRINLRKRVEGMERFVKYL